MGTSFGMRVGTPAPPLHIRTERDTLTIESLDGQPAVLAFLDDWSPLATPAEELAAVRAELRELGAVLVVLSSADRSHRRQRPPARQDREGGGRPENWADEPQQRSRQSPRPEGELPGAPRGAPLRRVAAAPQFGHACGNLMQRPRCSYFRDLAYDACNKRKPGSGCAAIDGWTRMHAVLGTSNQCIAAHPSDMCVALVALDATVYVNGPKGPRTIPITEFHVTPGDKPEVETVLAHGGVRERRLPRGRRRSPRRAPYSSRSAGGHVRLDIGRRDPLGLRPRLQRRGRGHARADRCLQCRRSSAVRQRLHRCRDARGARHCLSQRRRRDPDRVAPRRSPRHCGAGTSVPEGAVRDALEGAARAALSTTSIETVGVTALVELLEPPPRLFVCGTGHDALPVVALARSMGWRVTVATGHPSAATKDRFVVADELLAGPGSAMRDAIARHARPFAIVMSHDYDRDRECVAALLQSRVEYIGVLGPKRRTERVLAELVQAGASVTDAMLSRLHASSASISAPRRRKRSPSRSCPRCRRRSPTHRQDASASGRV